MRISDLIRPFEAAKRLGVSRQRVHALMDSGELPRECVGGQAFTSAAAVARHVPRPTGRPPKIPKERKPLRRKDLSTNA
jgi:hypothetical protein